MLHRHVHVPGSLLLHNLTLDGKLCHRDDKNAAFDMGDGPGIRHYVRAHWSEAGSDWLNPLSLGTMSASAYIEDLY